MAISYPGSLDNFSNPSGSTSVASIHAGLHSDNNDAIEALEAKVGATSSAVTTSHDYKLSLVTGSAKALTNNQPTITDFTNSTHAHTGTTSGGQLAEGALALTDITTNNVSSSKHGFAPKGDGSTSTFLNGNGAYSTPSVTGATMTTLMPTPYAWVANAANPIVNAQYATNTTTSLGILNFPQAITANAITLSVQAVGTAGTVKLSLYSEDGATRLFSVTTSTISGTGVLTVALSAVSITPGNYYLAITPVSTTDVTLRAWSTSGTDHSVFGNVSGKKVWTGTLTVTAGTPPTTITPTAITYAVSCSLIARFDN